MNLIYNCEAEFGYSKISYFAFGHSSERAFSAATRIPLRLVTALAFYV